VSGKKWLRNVSGGRERNEAEDGKKTFIGQNPEWDRGVQGKKKGKGGRGRDLTRKKPRKKGKRGG